jgi:LacI family gluconate utilization system Gnt-I transcriptional repressor
MKKRVTLADVAIATGVSAVTVSRALRQPEKVSDSLRRRIEHEVKKLGYYADPAASILASKRTNMIGMVVPSLSNQVFADVLRGVHDAIEGTPYTLQIGNSRYSLIEECRLLANFIMQKPAGLIVPGLEHTQECCKLMSEVNCPVVQIMDVNPDPLDMMVGFSNVDSAAVATAHLIEQGYRKIGFIGARMDPRAQMRLDGFKQVLKAHGLWDEGRVVTTPMSPSVTLGGQLAGEIIARAPDTDAVFCNADDLAAGFLFECQRRNIKVPEEMGICGFHDLEMASQLVPPITSVATPRYEIGKRAVQLLRQHLDREKPAEPVVVDLGFKLMVRASTQKKPRAIQALMPGRTAQTGEG